MKAITISELKSLGDKIKLIDLRSGSSFNNNHIPGAKNIEYNSLISNPFKYLSKSDKIYLYCQKGVKSYKMCLYLGSLGFDVTNVIGGYEAWVMQN